MSGVVVTRDHVTSYSCVHSVCLCFFFLVYLLVSILLVLIIEH